MSSTPFDGIKPHRLYLALYDLHRNHWALIVRGGAGVFFLDAIMAAGGRSQYRQRYWVLDTSKKSATILCNAMDLKDDAGVQRLLAIAQSTILDLYNYRGTWAEAVLQKASENGFALNADIYRLRHIILYEVTEPPKESDAGLIRIIEIH